MLKLGLYRKLFVAPVLLCAAGAWVAPATAADGYGDVTGQFVLKGDAPKVKLLIAKGDAAVKDAKVCAADDLHAEDVVVDADTKGVANVFIYLAKAKSVHPDLKESAEKEVVFDQKGCHFIPHAMFVRTDQAVVVKSDDAIAHNTHTFPLRNQSTNFLIAAGDRTGIKVQHKMAEKLPTQIKCDIHPWMSAYWLILDHPYAAVSDEKGNFKIEKLPVGDHEFIIWQESIGYVDRKFKVKVAADKVTDLKVIDVPASKIK